MLIFNYVICIMLQNMLQLIYRALLYVKQEIRLNEFVNVLLIIQLQFIQLRYHQIGLHCFSAWCSNLLIGVCFLFTLWFLVTEFSATEFSAFHPAKHSSIIAILLRSMSFTNS